MCSDTFNLSIPANQLVCEPNLVHVASKAFGHSGLLMCVSCFTPLILIPSITFICISVKLSIVNKDFSFKSTGDKFGREKNAREKVFLSYL